MRTAKWPRISSHPGRPGLQGHGTARLAPYNGARTTQVATRSTSPSVRAELCRMYL